MIMILTGIDHRGERIHRMGRTDAVLMLEKHTYAIEIKYAENEEDFPAVLDTAMEQIKVKDYYKPHLNQGRKVHLLALAFTKGNIAFREELI